MEIEYNTKGITIGDICRLMAGNEYPGMDFDYTQYKDCRPETGNKVNICYMCEEETWIRTYAEHPIIRKIADTPVSGISIDGDTIDLWINEKYW